MTKSFHQTILFFLSFSFFSLSYGQINKDTAGWNTLLLNSSFAKINSIKKIDREILSRFPFWKYMSKPGGKFNATDFGGRRRRRLYFIAKSDNHWIVSYEHGGRGHHTHCFLITIDAQKNLLVQNSSMKFESIDYLKAFNKTEKNLFSEWRASEY
jgi:hypothetical protein